MTINYNRRSISRDDAWLVDPVSGNVLGFEMGDSRQQKQFLDVGVPGNLTTIPYGTFNVPPNTQTAVFSSLTVTGTLVVEGELRVVAWPT